MQKIALLTDSTSDLPKDIIEKYNIKVIALQIHYEEKDFLDGVDIEPEEIYANIDKEIPKTSMPSVGYVLDFLKKLKEEGYTDILTINISAGLSGTVQMMERLKPEAEKLGLNYYCLDSKSVSMGAGFLVIRAAEMIQNKMEIPIILEKLNALKKEIRVIFVVRTLQYLRKGGRIGQVEGAIGDILNIKPVIAVNEEGTYYSLAKVRGWNRALKKMVSSIKENIDLNPLRKFDLGILHGSTLEEAQKVLKWLKEEINIENIENTIFGTVGAGVGVHAGPGVVGIVCCPREA